MWLDSTLPCVVLSFLFGAFYQQNYSAHKNFILMKRGFSRDCGTNFQIENGKFPM